MLSSSQPPRICGTLVCLAIQRGHARRFLVFFGAFEVEEEMKNPGHDLGKGKRLDGLVKVPPENIYWIFCDERLMRALGCF